MKKFTKFESVVIISSLNQGMSNDLAGIIEAEKAGKNPIFTADYIQQLYVDLMQKVEEMTKKK